MSTGGTNPFDGIPEAGGAGDETDGADTSRPPTFDNNQFLTSISAEEATLAVNAIILERLNQARRNSNANAAASGADGNTDGDGNRPPSNSSDSGVTPTPPRSQGDTFTPINLTPHFNQLPPTPSIPPTNLGNLNPSPQDNVSLSSSSLTNARETAARL